MMQAIKQSGVPKKWYVLCGTGDKSDSMAFDRFRIDGDTSNIKVGVFFYNDPSTSIGVEGNKHYVRTTPRQIQPFHSGGGWTSATYEHDFSFDLTGSTLNTEANTYISTIVISGLKPENKIYQVYAAPTGFSATRGKNAGLVQWHHGVGKVEAGGGDIGRLRLENQPFGSVAPLETSLGVAPFPIYAAEVDLRGADAGDTQDADYGFQQIVDGGVLNGTYRFDEASSASLSNKSTLESRGWTISGTVYTS